MNLFELIFIVLAVTAVATLGAAALSVARGAGAKARRLMVRLMMGSAIYALLLGLGSVLLKPPPFRLGDPRCFDDWCLTVLGGRRAPASPELFVVTLRLSSRARRRPMGEAGTTVYLFDSGGRRYSTIPDPADVAFDTLLQPGESVDTARRFRVPPDARDLVLVYRHTGFPIGWLIIGEGGWWQSTPGVHFDGAVQWRPFGFDAGRRQHWRETAR